ncbi:MAG: tetratricopeptide repeat protein [Pyrinomonadaceae bacterium]|nr:tetratricopeptide repeat protein [Pyrinomonadaceae bacterium]
MNKENILFATIGLLLGLIIGFVATNQINRNGYMQMSANPTAQSGQPTQSAPNPVPLQGVKEQPSSANAPPNLQQRGAPQPQVQEAIDKAKNNPNDFDAQIAVGKLYLGIQKNDDAAQYFDRAAALKPTKYEQIVMIGNGYFDSGKYEKSEKFYTQALTEKPNDVDVRTDLGLTFFLREPTDIERAIGEYQKSLQINPVHELTLQNLSAAQASKNDIQAMNETLNRLEKVNPNNPVIAKFRTEFNK